MNGFEKYLEGIIDKIMLDWFLRREWYGRDWSEDRRIIWKKIRRYG